MKIDLSLLHAIKQNQISLLSLTAEELQALGVNLHQFIKAISFLLKSNVSLTELRLSSVRLTDECLLLLTSGIVENQSLLKLHISSDSITTEGANKCIEKLQGNETLLDIELVTTSAPNNSEVSKLIFRNKRKKLYRLIYKGKTNEIEQFLNDEKLDLNLTDETGFAPLHRAVFLETTECMQLLIKHGADINQEIFSGELTPLKIALEFGLWRAADVLTSNNVNPILLHKKFAQHTDIARKRCQLLLKKARQNSIRKGETTCVLTDSMPFYDGQNLSQYALIDAVNQLIKKRMSFTALQSEGACFSLVMAYAEGIE